MQNAQTTILEASPILRLLGTISKLVGGALRRPAKAPLEPSMAYEIPFRSALEPRSILSVVRARAPEIDWWPRDPRRSNQVMGRARSGIVVTIDPGETAWLATVEIPAEVSPLESQRFLEQVEAELLGVLSGRTWADSGD